ncbi:MAG: metallophosphoesterase [Bryobacterales bacterium]
MKVLICSDIHNDLRRLEALAKTPADLYISAGDLVSWERGLPECGRILEPLGEKLWVLPGNHETAAQISSFCEQFGFRDFHGKSFEAGGRHFAGLGYSSPTPFNTPGEYSEDELTQHLSKFAALKPLVLVCHAPPLDTPLDDGGGGHFGSRAVRAFIEEHGPEHFFCGHIHEAAGRSTTLGKTAARNVGKQGYVLDL